MSDGNRNHNRNLRISRAPLKSQAHQGTSLFKSAVHGKHRSEMVSSGPNGSVRNSKVASGSREDRSATRAGRN